MIDNTGRYTGVINKHFYLCGHENVFNIGCQIIEVRNGDNLEEIARKWGKENLYDFVYVYDAWHNNVATYKIEWKDGEAWERYRKPASCDYSLD